MVFSYGGIKALLFEVLVMMPKMVFCKQAKKEGGITGSGLFGGT